MTINQIQDEIITEFSAFEDWMDKYEYLIELGKNLETFDEQYRTNQNLIDGCQSQVWLNAEFIDGKLHFTADSDAIITKGIVSLLIRIFTNQNPDNILNTNLYFIEKTGLQQHLSPTRSNGLMSMVKQMRLYAMAYKNYKGQSNSGC